MKIDTDILWAKTLKGEPGAFLPLIHHLIDVLCAAEVILDHFPPRTLRWLAELENVSPEEVRHWLCLLCGLHDVGKATPFFQGQNQAQKQRLVLASVPFPQMRKCRHGKSSYSILSDFFDEELGTEVARDVSKAVGAHHGIHEELRFASDRTDARYNDPDWQSAQFQIAQHLISLLDHRQRPKLIGSPPFLAFLSGLCAVADWIGSDAYHFSVDASETPAERLAHGKNRALKAVTTKGLRKRETPPARKFEEIFPFAPSILQAEAIRISKANPRLVMVEGLTGDGKTEAALILVELWRQAREQSGMYIALPTQATSNQMFDRVKKYVRGLPNPELHLAHGKAAFNDTYDNLKFTEPLGESDEAIASEWLSGPKNRLLAQYGVGTVDQILLSILRTKHGFIRLLALARKAVVLDEVHAYDFYMSDLLEHLLAWLAALDCTVVLLSATLPKGKRHQLIKAFGAHPVKQSCEYPRLTWSYETGVTENLHVPPRRNLALELEWLPSDSVVNTAIKVAAEGNCVAIVCNTVRRAQEAFQLLEPQVRGTEIDLDLFHARFPFEDRQEIESRVLRKFDKEGVTRPVRGSILIATQVIEQSLDLDFDYMISEMAPIDLLIQRAGRIQRHERQHRKLVPKLGIVRPAQPDGFPDFGSSKWIYLESILLRTFALLKDRTRWELPRDADLLIESVYGAESDLPFPWKERLAKLVSSEQKSEAKSLFASAVQKVVKPTGNVVESYNIGLNDDEDDPSQHAYFQAVTRLTEPSVTCVCLFRTNDGSLALDPSGLSKVGRAKPDRNTVRSLVERTVAISSKAFWKALVETKPPAEWQNLPVLKNYRRLEFSDGVAEIENTRLRVILDPRLGILLDTGTEQK